MKSMLQGSLVKKEIFWGSIRTGQGVSNAPLPTQVMALLLLQQKEIETLNLGRGGRGKQHT